MSNTVTQILSEEHNIHTQAGKKGICPFCQKSKTFSITRDDAMGKCFHPNCLKIILPNNNNKNDKQGIYNLFNEIYEVFHQTLLNQKKHGKKKNAYSYLIEKRRIHPKIVKDSMLGVVPKNFSTKTLFSDLIQTTKKAIKDEKRARKGNPGRPPKKDFDLKEWLVSLNEIRRKLEACLVNCSGWLCFFYTNEKQQITSIRFRKPYSKIFISFKPFTRAGLFGLNLFQLNLSKKKNVFDNHLVVMEGEFNLLQLQSLYRRIKKENYLNVTAVGGVNGADLKSVKFIDGSPTICFDNDSGKAGFALVENARKTMSVTCFTTPETNSDLDEYIRFFGKNYMKAWKKIKLLHANSKSYFRDYKGIKDEILFVRKNQGMPKLTNLEIKNQVAKMIQEDLSERGNFYKSEGPKLYFFSTEDKTLIEINKDTFDLALKINDYGINRADGIYNYLFEALLAGCYRNGIETRVYKLAYYNKETFTVYLSNFKNQIYRVSPIGIDLVDNGTDGVLFLTEQGAIPFEISEYKDTECLLNKIIISTINFENDKLTCSERRLMFTFWFFSLFFESIMPTKPILAILGPKGSGKSMTLRKVGLLLYGEGFNVMPLTPDVKDFDAAITNNYFVAIDNADTKVRWLDDKLATVSTGGTLKVRHYYSNNNLLELRVRCFLAITSRKPQFGRDDVADRLLMMKVKRFSKFSNETKFLEEVIKNRGQLINEVLHNLQEITKALKKYNDHKLSGNFRMADFADFATKISRYAGVEKTVRNIFRKLQDEQIAFSLESDPIFELLLEWAEKHPKQEVTNKVLCRELSALAENHGLNFPYKGKERSFSQAMSQLRPQLKIFFKISKRKAGARKEYFTFEPIG